MCFSLSSIGMSRDWESAERCSHLLLGTHLFKKSFLECKFEAVNPTCMWLQKNYEY